MELALEHAHVRLLLPEEELLHLGALPQLEVLELGGLLPLQLVQLVQHQQWRIVIASPTGGPPTEMHSHLGGSADRGSQSVSQMLRGFGPAAEAAVLDALKRLVKPAGDAAGDDAAPAMAPAAALEFQDEGVATTAEEQRLHDVDEGIVQPYVNIIQALERADERAPRWCTRTPTSKVPLVQFIVDPLGPSNAERRAPAEILA